MRSRLSRDATSVPEHIWTVLCGRSIVEVGTNKISLVDVVERVTLPDREILEVAEKKQITLGVPCTLASMFWREGPTREWQYRLDLVLPNGTRNKQEPLRVSGVEEVGSNRVMVGFQGVTFGGLGTYYFEVRTRPDGGKRWKRVARVPLQVVLEEE